MAAASNRSGGSDLTGRWPQPAAGFLLIMRVRRGEIVAWMALAASMLLVALVFLRRAGLSEESLPVLAPAGSFVLTNQFGLRVEGKDLEGYVTVVDVVFSRCPGQCHRLSQQMRWLQQSVRVGLPVRFVSLTADPEHDTPDVLRRYGERYGAEMATWLFLTGSKSEIYRWAHSDLKFSVVENDPSKVKGLEDLFIHSASFAVLDRRGRLRAMIQSEDADSGERLLSCVASLTREDLK